MINRNTLMAPFRQLHLWATCVQVWSNCVRASKRAHNFYKRVRHPLHGSYFCLSAWELYELHYVLFALIPVSLLMLLIVGWLIGEDP